MPIQEILIRPDGETVSFLLPNHNGDAGRQTVERRFRRSDMLRFLPASPFVYTETKGCVAAGIKGERLMTHLIRELHLEEEAARLGEGAYLIRAFQHEGETSLLLLGGDLSGFHYALSDAARHFRRTNAGLAYLGGEKCEIPAFPHRGFWNWDIRTQWNPDTDYPVRHCCLLDYPGDAKMYVDNMKRVIDGMVDYRKNVLTIWGFLRAEHGGIDAAQEICQYAVRHGIDVVPGIGTHFYGGPFLRGEHPFNLDTYTRDHRDRMETCRFGVLRPCPTDPQTESWLRDGVQWLFETFPIRGVNIENGDFFCCPCERCQAALRDLESRNPEFIQAQVLSYRAVLDELQHIPQSRWTTYATYTGFSPLYEREMDPLDTQYDPDKARREEVMMLRRNMEDKTLKEPLRLATEFPDAIAQWNVDPQLRRHIPLEAFLDEGEPQIVYDGPLWPRDLHAPTPRNIFYFLSTNLGFSLSALKELSVRVNEGGYEGVIDYGEISPRDIAAEINYLAMSHFAYHPKDTLRAFARTQLAHRAGGANLAEEWIELLCRKEAGTLSQEDRNRIWENARSFEEAMIHKNPTLSHGPDYSVDHFDNWIPYRYWNWLGA